MSLAKGSRVVFLSSHHLDDIYFSRSWGTFGYLMDCNKVGMASENIDTPHKSDQILDSGKI